MSGEARYSESIGILFVVKETPPSAVVSGGNFSFSSTGSNGTSSVSGSSSSGGNTNKNNNDVEVSGGVEIDGRPERLVTVKNLRPRRRVVIAVVNVSMYFSVTPVTEPAEGEFCDDAGGISSVCSVGGPVTGTSKRHFGGDSGGSGRSSISSSSSSVGFRGWGRGLGAAGVAGGIELFDVPAGESLKLRVTPRLDKLRSGVGLALLANEQSLEVRVGGY